MDTGFEGDLALPSEVIRHLDATYAGEQDILLADFVPRSVDIYKAVIDWQGDERTVEIMVMEGRPLLGTFLLEGNLIQIEMYTGGPVNIEPL